MSADQNLVLLAVDSRAQEMLVSVVFNVSHEIAVDEKLGRIGNVVYGRLVFATADEKTTR